MIKFEDNLIRKLEVLKGSKDFYDIDFCQMLLYIVYQNMTTLGNAYESINKEIIELLSNIDVIMNNRFETYFSECFTKFLDLNRE